MVSSTLRFCPEFIRSCGYEVFDFADRRIDGVASTDEIYALPK